MSEAIFESDYHGIGQMLNMPEMYKALEDRISRVRDLCEATAPVGSPAEPDKHAGRYKAGFKTAVYPRHGAKKDRPEGYVINDTPDAFWVEYGHAGMEPYHTMYIALLGVK
jgi:hypothetical protein